MPATSTARREVLPQTRRSVTHKFAINGHEGYLTIGLFEDGRPGEIFIKMSKEGSTLSGLIQGFCRAFSLALQHGLPAAEAAERFRGMRFEPMGTTANPEIPGDAFASIEPGFVSYAYFLRFKFEPGHYGLVGREALDGQVEPEREGQRVERAPNTVRQRILPERGGVEVGQRDPDEEQQLRDREHRHELDQEHPVRVAIGDSARQFIGDARLPDAARSHERDQSRRCESIFGPSEECVPPDQRFHRSR